MFARFEALRRHDPLVARRAGVRKGIFAADCLAAAARHPRRSHRVHAPRGSTPASCAAKPQKLAMVFLGLVFMHALGRKKFPDSALHRGEPDEALRFYIDVFLNGVRNS